jgi:hypothetical protein
MPLLYVIAILVAIGIVLYLINKYAPMDAKIKTILNWAVVIIVIIWLIKLLGLLDWLKEVRV